MTSVMSVRKLIQLSLITLCCVILLGIIKLGLSITSGVHSNAPRKFVRTPDVLFQQRKSRVDRVCATTRVPGRIHGVFTHKSGVLYCFVPKAGCTFWKSVFYTANNGNEAHSAPLSKNFIHTLYVTGAPYTSRHNADQFPTRLTVARDPYSRLLSSYLDKLYLPDFWPSEALNMIKGRASSTFASAREPRKADFLRRHYDDVMRLFPTEAAGNASSLDDSTCGKFLTFRDFVVDGFFLQEPHWMPIHMICNPCALNVSHVSHMETFTSDARVLLDKMDMGHLLDDVSPEVQINQELKTTIDYNFDIIRKPNFKTFYQNCITTRELGYRIWQSFRWRGYIDPHIEYTTPDFTDDTNVKADLLEQVWRARKSGLAKPESMRRAKDSFKMAAYSTLSKSLFSMLSRKYRLDFKLFGYESVRDGLFKSLYGERQKEIWLTNGTRLDDIFRT